MLIPKNESQKTIPSKFLYVSSRMQNARQVQNFLLKSTTRDFPGGPGIKDAPANAGDTGSIPGLGTKIPHPLGQLSLIDATTDIPRP